MVRVVRPVRVVRLTIICLLTLITLTTLTGADGSSAEDVANSLSRLIVKGDEVGVRLQDAFEKGLPHEKVKIVLDMRQSGQSYHAGKILNEYLGEVGIAGLSGKQVDRMIKDFRTQDA